MKKSDPPSRSQKVLFVCHASGIGGAERALIGIVRFLRNTPFDPVVIVPRDGHLKSELESIGVKVLVKTVEWWTPPKEASEYRRLRVFLEGLPSRVREIVKVIREENIAVVHSNIGIALEGALAAKLTRRPHVWHQHCTFRSYQYLSSWIPYGLIPYVFHALADVIPCCSQFLAQELFPRHLRRKVLVFYNGIDVEKLTPGPPQPDLRFELGLSPGTPLIGLLGTVYEVKGQLEFVEAAAQVRQFIPNAHFVLAGHDPSPRTYLKKVYDRIKKLHATDYIHYLGYRLDYVDIMKSLDVYVLASKLETLGMVVLEAMACGKPVVATRCGGPTEVVIDKETGLLVDVGDVTQLATAITDVLSRPDRGLSLGVKGRERVAAQFDQRKCLSGLPAIYQRLLDDSAVDHTTHDHIRISPYLVSLFLALCTLGLRMKNTVRWSLKWTRLSQSRPSLGSKNNPT